QEDVLDEVVDFSTRHASEQNAVYEWCVKIIKPREAVAVAFEDGADQHYLDRRLLRLLGGVCLGARQKHVGGCVHCVSWSGKARFKDTIKTGESWRLLTDALQVTPASYV